MHIVFSLIGIVGSLFMLKYREKIGDMIGDAPWMSKIGGVYGVVIIISLVIFFWSIAELTGTTDVFFRPLLFLLPGTRGAMQQPTSDFYID